VYSVPRLAVPLALVLEAVVKIDWTAPVIRLWLVVWLVALLGAGVVAKVSVTLLVSAI
jgi:hypothetical protein